MSDPREPVLLRLPASLKLAMNRRAVENKRSLTREVEFALERYIAPAPRPPEEIAAQ